MRGREAAPGSAFRMGGGLRLHAEFPLLPHGYYVEEVFAKSYWLVNVGYRFPIWPGQDRVHESFRSLPGLNSLSVPGRGRRIAAELRRPGPRQ